MGSQTDSLTITEFAPGIFSDIRRWSRVTSDFLFESFAPVNNYQAIHNFFTGAGKSQSFFFFTDNKCFVLKTLKESEKRLLFEGGVLENYYYHLKSNPNSLLSRFYGVYTIRLQSMTEIAVVVMNNLLGKDFISIDRIFDLKGSTLGRRVELSKEEQESSGLKVLKDLNFIELGMKLDIYEEHRFEALEIIEKDA